MVVRQLKPTIRTPKQTVRRPKKYVDPFYSSPEWKEASKQHLFHNPACCVCGTRERVMVDHIIERRDGGADLDPENFATYCDSHHKQKTAKARRARALGLANQQLTGGV